MNGRSFLRIAWYSYTPRNSQRLQSIIAANSTYFQVSFVARPVDGLAVAFHERDYVSKGRWTPRHVVVGSHVPQVDVPRVEDKRLHAGTDPLLQVLEALPGVKQVGFV
jgi:hypothetical protein